MEAKKESAMRILKQRQKWEKELNREVLYRGIRLEEYFNMWYKKIKEFYLKYEKNLSN